jgi:hypothetical protein
VESSAGEELESRAEGAVADEDPHKLAHDRFGVLHELGEPAAHLFQGREGEFRPDPVPGLITDGPGVHGRRAWPASLMVSRSHRVESGFRRSVKVRGAELVPADYLPPAQVVGSRWNRRDAAPMRQLAKLRSNSG